MTEILSLVLALAAVIALMLGAIWLMKWLTNRVSGNRGGKGIKISSCVGVGQDKSVMAVRAGKKKLLIGVTPAGISYLCDLDDEDMEIIESSSAAGEGMEGKSFAECLKYNMKKMGGEFIHPYGGNAAESSDDENGGE